MSIENQKRTEKFLSYIYNYRKYEIHAPKTHKSGDSTLKALVVELAHRNIDNIHFFCQIQLPSYSIFYFFDR